MNEPRQAILGKTACLVPVAKIFYINPVKEKHRKYREKVLSMLLEQHYLRRSGKASRKTT